MILLILLLLFWTDRISENGMFMPVVFAKEIPLGSRVAVVVDAFDAITHDRPYRKGRSVAEALEELKRCAGTQFDPTMVEIMVAVCQENPGQEVHV